MSLYTKFKQCNCFLDFFFLLFFFMYIVSWLLKIDRVKKNNNFLLCHPYYYHFKKYEATHLFLLQFLYTCIFSSLLFFIVIVIANLTFIGGFIYLNLSCKLKILKGIIILFEFYSLSPIIRLDQIRMSHVVLIKKTLCKPSYRNKNSFSYF